MVAPLFPLVGSLSDYGDLSFNNNFVLQDQKKAKAKVAISEVCGIRPDINARVRTYWGPRTARMTSPKKPGEFACAPAAMLGSPSPGMSVEKPGRGVAIQCKIGRSHLQSAASAALLLGAQETPGPCSSARQSSRGTRTSCLSSCKNAQDDAFY